MTTADAAVAWTVQRGVAMAIGTTTPAHMASDVAALKATLPDEAVERISNIYTGYTALVEEHAPTRTWSAPGGSLVNVVVAAVILTNVLATAALAVARRGRIAADAPPSGAPLV